MDRESRTPRIGTGALALALGATVGAAAAVYLAWRKTHAKRRGLEWLPPDLARIEEAAVDALRNDDVSRRRAIDVAALGPGIIELTGTVNDPDEAHHAVDVAQRVEGVHTVINRLHVAELERHLADTRGRLRTGDAALEETRWYGMNVGTGRRRQAADTDPARRDDRNDSLSRAMERDAMRDLAEPSVVEGPRPPLRDRST